MLKASTTILSATAIFAAGVANAAVVSLTGSDAAGTSSFNTSGNWSDNTAPGPGNDYFVVSAVLRTPETPVGGPPPSGGSVTFLGDSLQLGDDDNQAQLSLKNDDGAVITIPTLRLTGNAFVRNNKPDTTMTLAGSIELITATGDKLGDGGRIRSDNSGSNTDNRDLIVTSTISGSGPLIIEKGRDDADIFLRPSGTNTFSGGATIVTNSSTSAVFAENDFVLGAGNVNIDPNSRLNLSNGSTDNYIDDSASLVLTDNTSFIELDFSGTDTIGSLSFDGGSTIVSAGTWGAVGNGAADFTSPQILGNGLVAVIPEPSTYGILLMMTTLGAALYGRRRK